MEGWRAGSAQLEFSRREPGGIEMASSPTWLRKRTEDADEVREFPNGRGSLRLFDLGDEAVGYITYGVGWK